MMEKFQKGTAACCLFYGCAPEVAALLLAVGAVKLAPKIKRKRSK